MQPRDFAMVYRDWLARKRRPDISGSNRERERALALIVLELIFLVDLLALLVRMRRVLRAAERSGDERFARHVGVAAAGPRSDFLARHRLWLANQPPRGAAHQVDVDVIVVIDVGARRQHGGELLASRGLHVAQKALLFRQALPAIRHRNAAG